MSAWKRNRGWLTPVLLMAPGLALFSIVIVLSTLESLRTSLYEWDGIGPKVWIGLDNYRELVRDAQFYVSLKNNVIWLAIFLCAPPLGLAVALFVNQPIRGMKIAKSLFFVPLVLAPATVGVIYTWFYDPTFGVLAIVFKAFGGEAPAVLSNPNLVTFGVAIAALWPQVAFCMVLFLAGLNNLDADLLGAGRIDGAKGWRMLRHVVLPQLTQVTLLALAVSVVGALRSFDVVSVMTQGGPYGSSSVLAYQMYEQAIFSYRFGYGAALASTLFLIMIVFIVWYLARIFKAEGRAP